MQPREETAMSIASELLPCATAIALAMLALSPTSNALAQTTTQRSSVLPSGGGAALFDASDAVILLLDHLSGLFQTVKDISVAELRSNTIMLAKLATLLKTPVITTASKPNRPNGPIMPEIHQATRSSLHRPTRASTPSPARECSTGVALSLAPIKPAQVSARGTRNE